MNEVLVSKKKLGFTLPVQLASQNFALINELCESTACVRLAPLKSAEG